QYLADHQDLWQFLWAKVHWRQGLLSLNELQNWDWPAQPPQLFYPRAFDPPLPLGTTHWDFLPPRETDFGLGFIPHYLQRFELDARTAPRQNDLEAPLFVIAFLLAPLARAEVNRARRQYAAAIQDLVSKRIVIRLVDNVPVVVFVDRNFGLNHSVI